MSYGRVHCQVVETPADEDGMPRGQDWPRDLLPWADPYIAILMVRLERRYDWADDSPPADEAAFRAAQRDSWSDGAGRELDSVGHENAWQDDAFMPRRHEGRRPMFPPMYGGFPLLDDVTDGLEEDPF